MNANKKNRMSFTEFCDRLIADGAYQSEKDGHIYRASGNILSRQCRNGYYLLRKQYDGITYHFMEHRVVYYMHNGKFDEGLQINHKDFDRTNNRIENLELMTSKENINYTINAGRKVVRKGPDNARAAFTEKEVQLIRYLKKNGWISKDIRKMFDNRTTEATINRVVERTRYGEVVDASGVMAIYPAIVEKTRRKDLNNEEALKNACMGLAGECGELIDLVKKYFYQGSDLDLIHAQLELGDIIYYIYWISMMLGINMSDIMFANMEKLSSRYPDGFDVERANNRAEGDV